MRVLIIGGPSGGTLVDVKSQDVEFVSEGETYAILYEVFSTHPVRRMFKMAAAFAVPKSTLGTDCAAGLTLDEDEVEILHSIQDWRYLPYFNGEKGR